MRFILLSMLGLAAGGCATRALPAHFPASTPASAAAPEAPRPAVTTALTSVPPLPGEDTTAWQGLEPGPAETAASAPAPAPAPSPAAPPQGGHDHAH